METTGTLSEQTVRYHPTRQHALPTELESLAVDFTIRLRRLDRTPATCAYYEYTVRRFLAHYQRGPLESLTGEHLERYLYERPLSPRSMATELVVLRVFFRFLIRAKGFKVANPADDVDRLWWREKPRPSPTKDEYRKILAVCRTDEERRLVTLTYVCGFRVSELRSIRWSNIDEKERCITVRGKGRKERTVPFPESVLPLILSARTDQDYLFPSRQYEGRSRQVDWVERTLRRLGQEAGLRYKLTCHVLRYGFCRMGRKAGLSLEEVSFLMGHNDISTTANVYHRLHIEDVRPGYREKVEKYLQEA